jgi:hypothetical protein
MALPKFRMRLYGVVVASLIAASIASALSVNGGEQPSANLLAAWALFILPAGLAALALSTRVHGRWPDGAGDVLAMAVVTYAIGVLLFPVIQSLGAWPAVSNGGQVPCLNLRPGAALYEGCASGLHGSAAWDALVTATVGYYELTPVALIVCSPLIVVLAVPSLVWVLLMRWFERRYQRSV